MARKRSADAARSERDSLRRPWAARSTTGRICLALPPGLRKSEVHPRWVCLGPAKKDAHAVQRPFEALVIAFGAIGLPRW